MTYDPAKDVPRTKQDALAQLEYIASLYRGDVGHHGQLARIWGLLSDQTPEFHRDHGRYIVLKTKDLNASQLAQVTDWMRGHGIKGRKCICIEEGWPEYEPTWNLLADRVQREEAEQRDGLALIG